MEPPLIVTLQLAEKDMQFFNELRKENFPAHINYMDAHLTLFHNLPSNDPVVTNTLKEFAQMNSFTLRVSMVKHIGNGVVYIVQSSALQRMHLKMQLLFKPWLTRKDAQKLWPHITVQN